MIENDITKNEFEKYYRKTKIDRGFGSGE